MEKRKNIKGYDLEETRMTDADVSVLVEILMIILRPILFLLFFFVLFPILVAIF